ncbi:MAG: hypothetical protein RIC29_00145 [Rhodospirillaceae bacterium]
MSDDNNEITEFPAWPPEQEQSLPKLVEITDLFRELSDEHKQTVVKSIERLRIISDTDFHPNQSKEERKYLREAIAALIKFQGSTKKLGDVSQRTLRETFSPVLGEILSRSAVERALGSSIPRPSSRSHRSNINALRGQVELNEIAERRQRAIIRNVVNHETQKVWTCNGFAPVTYLIMPPWPRMRAG